jgi:hypothetical protein
MIRSVLALAIAAATLTSAPALAARTCAPALGMVETSETATGNSGRAWLKTERGSYSGTLVGTANGTGPFPDSLDYTFTTTQGTLLLRGVPDLTRLATFPPVRYTVPVDLQVLSGTLANSRVTGGFRVSLSVNKKTKREYGSISSGTLCH